MEYSRATSTSPIELLVHLGRISRNRVSFTTTVGNLHNRRIRHFIPDWLNPFSIESTSPAFPFHNFSRSPVLSLSAHLRTVLLMLPPGVSYLVSTWIPSSQPPSTNRHEPFHLRGSSPGGRHRVRERHLRSADCRLTGCARRTPGPVGRTPGARAPWGPIRARSRPRLPRGVLAHSAPVPVSVFETGLDSRAEFDHGVDGPVSDGSTRIHLGLSGKAIDGAPTSA